MHHLFAKSMGGYQLISIASEGGHSDRVQHTHGDDALGSRKKHHSGDSFLHSPKTWSCI